MTKVQITLTLDPMNEKALRMLADKTFYGNVSMALRAHLEHTKLTDIIKHIENGHNTTVRELGCKFCQIGR